MTTDQKLAHVQWYIDQVGKSRNIDTKREYIAQGRGALGAWFAEMSISHEQYESFYQVFKELTEGLE